MTWLDSTLIAGAIAGVVAIITALITGSREARKTRSADWQAFAAEQRAQFAKAERDMDVLRKRILDLERAVSTVNLKYHAALGYVIILWAKSVDPIPTPPPSIADDLPDTTGLE